MSARSTFGITCIAAASVVLVTSACTPSGPGGAGNSGSSSKPRSGGSIAIGVGEPFSGWDPSKATTTTDYEIIKEVLEPLVVMNAKGTAVQPALADSYRYNKAHTELTVDLPPKAVFSDGTPLTSADVAFSVRDWKASPSGSLYASIKSVATPTAHQVVFTLGRPDSSLLPALTWANSAVIKKDFGGKSRAAYFKDPIGSGPFMVASYSPGAAVALKKNPRFHRSGLPHLDSVTFKIINDPSQRVLQFKSGDIDVYDRVAPDLAAQLPKADVVSVPGAAVTGVIFNVKKSGPTSNVNFRKAVSLAIDRKALVDSVYSGEAQVATAVQPPHVPGWTSCGACDYPKQDLTAAKKALAVSGYDGRTVELLVDSTNGTNVLAAQALPPMLKKAGINVAVKQVDLATAIARATAGDITMSIADYHSTSPTLNDALGFWYGTGGFFTQSDPEQFLTAYGAVAAAANTAELKKASSDFEEVAFKNKWMAPVANLNNIFGIQPRVKGFTVNPLTIYNLSDIYVTS